MTFDQQVTKLIHSCFVQLRNIAKIRCIFSSTALEVLIHAFNFPCPDYCNSLYTCLSQEYTTRSCLLGIRHCMTLPHVTFLISSFVIPLLDQSDPQILAFYKSLALTAKQKVLVPLLF